MADIVIFDPEERPPETPEQKVRPTEHGVIQLQMRDLYNYEMYWAPNEMEEFEDINLFTHRLKMMIKKWLVEEHQITRIADLNYEADTLCERGLSLMTNYKIANVDLHQKIAYEVRTEVLKHTPPGNRHLIY
jgi:hypothetical protein